MTDETVQPPLEGPPLFVPPQDDWTDPAPDDARRTYRPSALSVPSVASSLSRLGMAIVLVFGGLGLGLGYWQVVQAEALSTDPGNPLVQAATRNAPRGLIFDVAGTVVADNLPRQNGIRTRTYPIPAMAPVVGYQSLFVGGAGLERTYDAELSGLGAFGPGGQFFRKFLSDPYDPASLRLTVDARLQQAAMDALGFDRGAVVAIDPRNGRILALASTPSFDPNQLVDPGSGLDYLDSLRDLPSAPLLDRATQGRYVPGSVFKIVTAIAGLGSGAIDAGTTYDTQPQEYFDGFRVQGFRIHDSPRDFQTDHPLDFTEAIEVSSNIYFAHVGLDTGGAAMVEAASRLGFGSSIDFELPTSTSQVNDDLGPIDGFADRVDLANAAYGQSRVLTTPLQMALVAAAVGNDGTLMHPYLVDRIESSHGQVRSFEPSSMGQVMGGDVAQIIQRAMVTAVQGEYGQFFTGAAQIPGVTVAGKSGTAELDAGAPHSWFIGFAPADDPVIAIAVVVEHGGFGSTRAVPMGGDLMQLYLELLGG
ncbi:MAG: penicillin-binding protein 2 [Candidatus Limnocylindrales bacterium]